MFNILTHRPKKLRATHLWVLTFLLAAWADQAGAQTIVYDHLAAADNPVQVFGINPGTVDYIGIVSMAQSFTTDHSGLISSLSLNLQTLNPNRPVYDVELWSDSGGLPGTRLRTFIDDRHWNLDQVSTFDSSHVVTLSASDFVLNSNFSLTSGTTYWIVIATTDGQFKGWGVSSVSDEPGAIYGPSAFMALNTSTWAPLSLEGESGNDESLGLRVSVVSAIPEPGTYAALGGLAVLGFAVFRKRQKSGILR